MSESEHEPARVPTRDQVSPPQSPPVGGEDVDVTPSGHVELKEPDDEDGDDR